MWNDEEEPQWGAEETTEEAKPEEAAAAAPAEGGEAAPAEGAPAEGAPAAEEAVPQKRDPNRPVYFKHWVRPKFLQYSYLYDYRKNYYDDVIDFMDRRSHGISRDIPKPQTWGERVLRTYTQKIGPSSTAIKKDTDNQLIHTIHHCQAIHHVHSKDYYSKRYSLAY